jgi:hypothetical protein
LTRRQNNAGGSGRKPDKPGGGRPPDKPDTPGQGGGRPPGHAGFVEYFDAINEALVAADSFSSTGVIGLASIADALSALDTVSAGGTFRHTIVETTTAVEFYNSGGAIRMGSIAETLSCQDTVTASARFASGLVETMTAAATQDGSVSGGAGGTGAFLLESGDALLLETGDRLLTE